MSQGDVRINIASGFTHHTSKMSRKLPDAKAVDMSILSSSRDSSV